ncbi:hypothetical protein [Clostridium butyricum]|uniref:hypothetical protein n=1 Tax=Clostridium butyricum TaxID=1492 RepID=UPI000A6430FC|nr:hypothetical protein [Clostridium butyricum]
MIEFSGMELIDIKIALEYRLETLKELNEDSTVWNRDIEHLTSALDKITDYLK